MKRPSNVKVTVLLFTALLVITTLLAGACSSPAATTTPAATSAPATSAPTASAPAKTTAAPATSAAPAATIKLRFAGNHPVGQVLTNEQMKFKELVETRSKGAITIELFPAGQLYTDTDYPNVIPAGTIDLAQGSAGKWAGIVPALLYTNLPGLFDTDAHTFRFVDGPGFKVLDEDLNKVNTKLLGFGWMAGGDISWGILSNKQIKVMADMKGLKIRSTDAIGEMAMQAVGAKTVSLASAETYSALQLGTVDGALSGTTPFVTWKWAEVTKYSVLFPGYWSNAPFPITMNLAKFKSLTPALQDIVFQSAQDADKWARPIAAESNKKDTLTIQNSTITYTLTKDEYAKWTAVIGPATLKYFTERGGPSAVKVLDAVKATK